MIDHRPIVRRTLLSALLFTVLSFGQHLAAQDGKTLFQNNCASCHSVTKKLTGPALAGVESRGPWSDREQIYAWVHNPAKFMADNEYTQGLHKEYGVMMSAFPSLKTEEIDAIVEYINKTATTANKTSDDDGGGKVVVDEKDNSILYGVLSLILAVIALVMLQVNANLRKLADDKSGVPSHEPIPFYRNKTYIAMLTLVLFVIAGYFLSKGAIGLGRSQNYEPVQPIYYSHKVHAGTNQIACLYCHTNAWESKHATIPSVNVCMNCHMAINEYTGEKLYTEDGQEVDGTKEIKKLYDYAGFTPGENSATWDPSKAKPIEWVKIHNLPDHVYFNHSQHVRAGHVQCQTCHGEIQKMNEVYQFADLSMGWCVNCHRTTKVDFVDSAGTSGNKFYSIYEKYHEEIKNGTRDSVTVAEIGGTDCQKCHY